MIITLLRKPLDGSVAENALQHGCGAINIDATRVGFVNGENPSASSREAYTPNHSAVADMNKSGVIYSDPTWQLGRWPANFILTHLDGCELRGTKKVKGNRTDSRPEGDGGREDKSEWRFRPTSATKRGYSDDAGKETIADWACVEGCPVREMDIQSGHLKSTTRKPTGNPIYPTSNTSVKWNANNVIDTTQRGFNDDGGASRFFMQFQKDN